MIKRNSKYIYAKDLLERWEINPQDLIDECKRMPEDHVLEESCSMVLEEYLGPEHTILNKYFCKEFIREWEKKHPKLKPKTPGDDPILDEVDIGDVLLGLLLCPSILPKLIKPKTSKLDDYLNQIRQELDCLYEKIKTIAKKEGRKASDSKYEDGIQAMEELNLTILQPDEFLSKSFFSTGNASRDIKGGILKAFILEKLPGSKLNAQELYKRYCDLVHS